MERDSYIQKDKQYTKQYKTQNTQNNTKHRIHKTIQNTEYTKYKTNIQYKKNIKRILKT